MVNGRLPPETTSLLLRADQIAKSTLKPRGKAGRRESKSVRGSANRALGDAEERSAES